jgi:hypothetical protein
LLKIVCCVLVGSRHPWHTAGGFDDAPGLPCLPLERLDRHQRDHQQSGLFVLLADPLIIGYAPMMKFAASLPTHSMHIIRPQS